MIGLKAIGKVMATREKAGKTTTQTCLLQAGPLLSAEHAPACSRQASQQRVSLL